MIKIAQGKMRQLCGSKLDQTGEDVSITFIYVILKLAISKTDVIAAISLMYRFKIQVQWRAVRLPHDTTFELIYIFYISSLKN